MTCRFCQASVELVENLESKNGNGSIWMFQCQNESCLSQETNLAFPTTEKSRTFAINRASVLGFRATCRGGGHTAAPKVLCVSLINKNSWATAAKSIYVDREFEFSNL